MDSRLSQNVQDIRKCIKFIEKNMKTGKMDLAAQGKSLVDVKIQRGIFKVIALSPFVFVITTMPLSQIRRKCTGVDKLTKSQEKCIWIASNYVKMNKN